MRQANKTISILGSFTAVVLFAVGLPLLLGSSGCFNPEVPDTAFTCGEDGACPDGFECRDDGCCHREGSPLDEHGACAIGPDAAVQVDASAMAPDATISQDASPTVDASP